MHHVQADAVSRPTCSTCTYLDPTVGEDGEPRADCRRWPPVLIVLDGYPTKVLPQVDSDDWCGEHRRGPQGRGG